MCFRCRKGPAKELLIVGQQIWARAFCSVICAVEHGINEFTAKAWIWCEVHKEWHLHHNGCYQCQKALGTVKEHHASATVVDQAAESEVSNEPR